MTTTLQPADLDLVALMDRFRAAEIATKLARLAQAPDHDARAAELARQAAADVLNGLKEVTIGWGEDTRCGICPADLPAGAPAYRDADSTLCVDCGGFELEAAGRTV